MSRNLIITERTERVVVRQPHLTFFGGTVNMSLDGRQAELNEQTQQLLQGPLKHIRSAALAAALLPLASVVATPAAAQSAACASGGICGYVWNDANDNGIQDAGESGIEGAVVSLDSTYVTATDAEGFYYFIAAPDT